MHKYVIIIADIIEGIKEIIGPFDFESEAEEFMEQYNFGHYTKGITEICQPEDYRG